MAHSLYYSVDDTPAQQNPVDPVQQNPVDPVQGPVGKTDGTTGNDNTPANAAPTVTLATLTIKPTATSTATANAPAAKQGNNANAVKMSALALIGMASAWILA